MNTVLSMNRFSNDFTTTSSVYATNSNLQQRHHMNNNNATTLGTATTDKRLRDIGDLHSVSVSNEHGDKVEDDEEEGDKHHQYAREYQTIAIIPSEAIAKTMYVSTTDLIPDDDDEFRVSKPLMRQSDSSNRSHGFESESLTTASTQPDRDRHRNVPQHAIRSKGSSKCCTTAENKTSRVQTSSENVSRSAHIQFDLKSSESCSSSGTTSCESIVNVAEGVENMRLNVPAAADVTQHEGGHASAAGRLLNKNNNAPTPTVTARILENGTLMGSVITTQPSLTIHVNQSDHNSQQQQDVVNQSSGVSIVNCYRAVPVHIVNSVSYSNVNNNSNGDSDASTMHVVNNSNSKKCDNTKSKINDLEIIQVINEPMDNQRNIGTISSIHQQQQRTFTSTEAQTDDLQHFPHHREESDVTPACISSVSLGDPTASHPLFLSQSITQDNPATDISIPLNLSREQRRRDRRERRQARNSRQQHIHPVPMPIRPGFEILPDILNSHVPPPYTALSLATAAIVPQSAAVLTAPINNALPIVGGATADDERYTFPLPIIRR